MSHPENGGLTRHIPEIHLPHFARPAPKLLASIRPLASIIRVVESDWCIVTTHYPFSHLPSTRRRCRYFRDAYDDLGYGKDNGRNGHIRGSLGVVDLREKVREHQLGGMWLGGLWPCVRVGLRPGPAGGEVRCAYFWSFNLDTD